MVRHQNSTPKVKDTHPHDKNIKITKQQSDQPWVNQIAAEIKAQREYNTKWGRANEQLYNSKNEVEQYPQKSMTTRWTPFSIINQPTGNPLDKNLGHQKPNNNNDMPAKQNSEHLIYHLMLRFAKFKNENTALPQEYYKVPATSNQEYGWMYGKDNNRGLERFGSMSAKFK